MISLFVNFESNSQVVSDISIKELIHEKREYNTRVDSRETGYKIQLFNGGENYAREIKNDFETTYPDTQCMLIWKSPDFRVWVGNYRTRLEADRALNDISKYFKHAIVFKSKS